MDEDSKEVLKIGMEAALRPVTGIASDVLGLAGGLWLHEQHERLRARLQARTAEILRERGVENPEAPSPSVLVPLLAQAQNELRDELVDVWAKLLATAMDPKRSSLYRREFVDIAREMEPIEAVLLPLLNNSIERHPNRVDYFKDQLGKSRDEIDNAFRHLHKVGLINTNDGFSHKQVPIPTSLGRQLLAAIG